MKLIINLKQKAKIEWKNKTYCTQNYIYILTIQTVSVGSNKKVRSK